MTSANTKTSTCPVSIRFPLDRYKMFQKLYPYCFSRFIKLCVIRAVKDKDFFNEIYFNTICDEV